ncbi:SDR family oxidoreductase [Streptomyces boncukensis]|uniref:SDR family oxidoreductase n=1 Tax=Streptomyces boncukensis TaxID=2711219 RepID=A0A6G4WR02_9ACTN|nr:SDR family oxidoreductase [Streptomyces boncukensis]NGO67528.1 SDR family oxidoreductase [Streptomyces boncukensis]
MPTAVITGSDSGIGRTTAVRLAERGMDIGITWNSDRAGAEEAAEEVRAQGRRVAVAHLDLTRLPEAADVIDAFADQLDGLDVLVNNAGTGPSGTPYTDIGLEQLRTVIDIDLMGPFLCGQRAAQLMIEQGRGGCIVNVTSVHEHQPRVGAASYCAAKGGLGLLTQVMALELAEHGIRVNAVAPGEISTPMTGQGDVDPHSEERPGIPLGRTGHAHEVAAVIAYLADADAGSGYVTGGSWAVDGGMLRMGPQAGSHLESDAWRPDARDSAGR